MLILIIGAITVLFSIFIVSSMTILKSSNRQEINTKSAGPNLLNQSEQLNQLSIRLADGTVVPSCPYNLYVQSSDNVCKCPDSNMVYDFVLNKCVSSCSPGYVNINGICNICPAGSYYDPTKKHCILCNVGYYADSPGSYSCDKCRSGTVAPNMGSTICESCTAGSYSNMDTNTCDMCRPGHYSSTPEASECLPCEQGSYAPTSGSMSCLPCKNAPAGSSTCI